MQEVGEGIRRITFPLPMAATEVHCYLVPVEGGWLLVDTGLGLPGLEEYWTGLVRGLAGPVLAILVTHFHPDHVGGSRAAAAATGAPVLQGELDRAQALRVWGSDDAEPALEAWFRRHGTPAGLTRAMREEARLIRSCTRLTDGVETIRPGETVHGWRADVFPGHADGHLCFHRDGVLLAGDLLMLGTTPVVALFPESRPDPVGDYLASLERLAVLAPRLALPGHGAPVGDPAGRAREIAEHHTARLEAAGQAIGNGPRTAYQVARTLFPQPLSATFLQLAVGEALAHLEHLALAGRATRGDADGCLTYTSA